MQEYLVAMNNMISEYRYKLDGLNPSFFVDAGSFDETKQ